jgi:hypothetical protein
LRHAALQAPLAHVSAQQRDKIHVASWQPPALKVCPLVVTFDTSI